METKLETRIFHKPILSSGLYGGVKKKGRPSFNGYDSRYRSQGVGKERNYEHEIKNNTPAHKSELNRFEKRPARNVNFRGSFNWKKPLTALKGALTSSWFDAQKAEKTLSKGFLTKLYNYTYDKVSVMEALMAGALCVVAKPVAAYFMPGADKKDTEVAAFKYAASGILGVAFGRIIYGPISDAFNLIRDEARAFVERGEAPKFIKNKALLRKLGNTSDDAAKQFTKGCGDLYKFAPQVFTGPLRGLLSIALIPVFMKLLFGDRVEKKKEKFDNNMPLQYSNYAMLSFKKRSEVKRKELFQ